MDISIKVSNRELSPAVLNFFQYENQTVTLKFTLDSYMYGEVDLRNYKAYGVTSQNGMVDMTELVSTYDTAKDELTLTWQVQEYSLRQVGPILYQICFKENANDGENTAVFYSYKGVMINRGSIDGDNHLTANYPTLLKQWLDKMNNMAELFDAGVVYMPYGQSIPVSERLAGRLYFQYTDKANTTGQFEDNKGNVLTDPNVMHLIGAETVDGTKTFKMSPLVPTATVTDNSTKVANTAFVHSAINELDDKVVHKTDTEEIGGAKTFSDTLTIKKGLNFSNASKIIETSEGVLSLGGSTPEDAAGKEIATADWVRAHSGGKPIGEVFYSQSNKAEDNPGGLPLFTGESIVSANTIYPDFCKWVGEHYSDLCCSESEYETALTTYGECPKYSFLNGSVTAWDFSKTANPSALSGVNFQDGLTAYTKGTPWVSISKGSYLNVYADKECTVYLSDSNGIFHFSTSGDGYYNLYQGVDTVFYECKFQKGDGEFVKTTLRLPKLSNYIKMANTTDGITQSGAGLPNITGSVTDTYQMGNYATNIAIGSGALYSSKSAKGGTSQQSGNSIDIHMDASLSSEVYGKSDTVTPAHTTLYPWVFAYLSSIPASTAQTAEFQSAISGKADYDLGNVPANYDYVVEEKTFENGDKCRVWKSGRLEQWGLIPTGNAAVTTLTFIRPFSEVPIVTVAGVSSRASTAHDRETVPMSVNETGFVYYNLYPQGGTAQIYWKAEGQGA